MALSRYEIQRNSNARRGVVSKTFKLKQEISLLIDQLAEEAGLSRAALVTEAVQLYAKTHGITPKA